MVVIKYRIVVKSRIIDMRRAGIKVRMYENAKVYLKGTAGRGKRHWAYDDFKGCIDSPYELLYFSGDTELPAIAIHGDHVHILKRSKGGKLIPLSVRYAEKLLFEFINKLREKGVSVEIRRHEEK